MTCTETTHMSEMYR